MAGPETLAPKIFINRGGKQYHKKSPDSVVKEDDRSSDEHREANELIEL